MNIRVKGFEAYIGYTVYTSTGLYEKFLETCLSLVDTNARFVVVGGAAVVHYLGKSVRQVSPDVDILVTQSFANKLKKLYPNAKGGTRGFSIELSSGASVDVLVNTNIFYNHLMRHPTIHENIPYVSLPNLIAMKLEAGRDKDQHDLEGMHNLCVPPVLMEAGRTFLRFFPSRDDDWESFHSLTLFLRGVDHGNR
jgi:hypothetical protein